MRKYRKYFQEECLSYLEGYLSYSLNQRQIEKNGLTQNSIRRWVRIFDLEDNPDPVMSKKLSQDRTVTS